MTDPAPLVPADIDLRDFAFMPLQVERLRRSKQCLLPNVGLRLGFIRSISGWQAWHEVPCGSLEDDDDVLADAAMCAPEQWPIVKADVLRGWVKCSDGRIYHQIVCEKAAEAWSDKVHYRWRKECERVRKETSVVENGIRASRSSIVHRNRSGFLPPLKWQSHNRPKPVTRTSKNKLTTSSGRHADVQRKTLLR